MMNIIRRAPRSRDLVQLCTNDTRPDSSICSVVEIDTHPVYGAETKRMETHRFVHEGCYVASGYGEG